jgi:hypothetical protein
VGQTAYAFAPAAFGILREIAPEAAVYVVASLVQVAAVAAYILGRGTRRRTGATGPY